MDTQPSPPKSFTQVAPSLLAASSREKGKASVEESSATSRDAVAPARTILRPQDSVPLVTLQEALRLVAGSEKHSDTNQILVLCERTSDHFEVHQVNREDVENMGKTDGFSDKHLRTRVGRA